MKLSNSLISIQFTDFHFENYATQFSITTSPVTNAYYRIQVCHCDNKIESDCVCMDDTVIYLRLACQDCTVQEYLWLRMKFQIQSCAKRKL